MEINEANALVVRVRVDLRTPDALERPVETWILDIDNEQSLLDLEWLDQQIKESFRRVMAEFQNENFNYSRSHRIHSWGSAHEMIEFALTIADTATEVLAAGAAYDLVKAIGKNVYAKMMNQPSNKIHVKTSLEGNTELVTFSLKEDNDEYSSPVMLSKETAHAEKQNHE